MSAVEATEARRQRGLAIAAICRIEQKHGQWVVPSQTGNGFHRVNLAPTNPHVPMCTCPDFEERGQPCKHVWAVRAVIERQTSPDGTATTTKILTITERTTTAPKPTYKQAWPAYHAAQVNEKHKFQGLLHDLCRGIPEPRPNDRGGRPRIRLADRVFAVAFKVYSTVSTRRFSCDLKDAHERGWLDGLPHYNSVMRYLEDPAMTPLLKSLIVESSKPLQSVDVDFAADSSGFSTSRFTRWFDEKYGRIKTAHEWVKLHLMCGVKTNVVTAAEILGQRTADCPQFIPLLKTTAETFTVREASADCAYSSYDNCEAVSAVGGTPFIAYKCITTAAKGGMYEKMFHYYNFNRDDFLTHYHKRSNVESTFSMIKAKFRDHVRSKTDTAMANEVYCKVLCHNICCLIQSAYELGIASTFWGADAEPATMALDDADMMEAMAWI